MGRPPPTSSLPSKAGVRLCKVAAFFANMHSAPERAGGTGTSFRCPPLKFHKDGTPLPPSFDPCCERTEMWSRVADVPDYAISNLGRVRRETPGKGTYVGRIIKPVRRSDGHLYVSLPPGNGDRLRNTRAPRPKHCFIALHRLVVAAWLPPVPDETWKDPRAIIHHKDWLPEHNCDTNLAWKARSKHLKEHKAKLRKERGAQDLAGPWQRLDRQPEKAARLGPDLARRRARLNWAAFVFARRLQRKRGWLPDQDSNLEPSG